MIKTDAQHINVCTRALIIENGQLAVSAWDDGSEHTINQFMIGGRVEYGESITTALIREIEEETGAIASIDKLIYMHENIFTDMNGVEVHEFGYYFLVSCDRVVCPDGLPSPHGDHPKLVNKLVPISKDGLSELFPKFLADYLPLDYQIGFTASPRMIYSHDPRQIVEEHTGIYFDRVPA